MSLKGFIAGLLGGQNPMRPSEAMLHHVNGSGSGYELDDLVHWSPSDQVEQEAVEPLLSISRQYSTAEYPIGISNPASFDAIRTLAERLREKVSNSAMGGNRTLRCR